MDIYDEHIPVNSIDCAVRHISVNSDKETPVLVFLHDALGSISQWKEFPLHLATENHLNAIVFERQGHGGSSPLTQKRTIQYLHQEAYQFLPKLLANLNINRPILVGHSDGATISLLYASRFKTEAVISIAAHVFVEEITTKSIQDNLSNEQELKGKLKKYHGDKTGVLFSAWAETWLSEEFQAFNIEEEIQTIEAPTFVIQSKDDEYGTVRQVDCIYENIRSEVKDILLLDKGGHMLHLTEPDTLEKEISYFLSKCVNS